MAGFRETLTLVVDVVADKSTTSIRNLSTELKNTDGVFGKMKVAGAGAFDFLSANAGAFAAAGGAAIAGFAAKAIGDFQDTALGAGKLRDSLGVTAEEASRLQEVAGDLGIGVESLESSIGKMNLAAAKSPEAFDEIGASIKRNKDGTIDVMGTFESVVGVINKIPDAAQRAEAAQKIFGKGWKDIAELVESGADGVREAMAGVEKQKLIDDEEIEKARKFRDTLDELKGVGESASIAVGGKLVDGLNDVKVIVDQVKGPVEDLAGALDKLGAAGDVAESKLVGMLVPSTQLWHAVEFLSDAVGGADDAVAEFDATLTDSEIKARTATDAASAFEERLASTTGTAEDATDATEDLAAAYQFAGKHADTYRQNVTELREALIQGTGAMFNQEAATLELQNSYAALSQSQTDLTKGIADGTLKGEDAAVAMRDLRLEEIGLAEQAYNTALQIANQSGAQEGSAQKAQIMKDELRRLAEQMPSLREEIQAYIDRLNAIPTSRTTRLNVVSSTGAVVRGVSAALAEGGPVEANRAYLVGEEGPELLVPRSSGTIIPNGTPVGGTVHVTINMPPGSNGNDVVRAIKQYERVNGKGWRAS